MFLSCKVLSGGIDNAVVYSIDIIATQVGVYKECFHLLVFYTISHQHQHHCASFKALTNSFSSSILTSYLNIMAVLSYLLTIMAATGSVIGADVTVCTDKNFGGRCQTWVSAHGSCGKHRYLHVVLSSSSLPYSLLFENHSDSVSTLI